MVFSSVTFVFVFLPLVFAIYFLVYGGGSIKKFGTLPANTFLLIASLFFYAWGEPRYVLILLASMLLNYFFALLVDGLNNKSGSQSCSRQLSMALGITANLGLLGYYKYMNFFVDIGGATAINHLLPDSLTIGAIAPVVLPLGISFFTFQGMSYLIDVYRKQVPVTYNLINFGCYLTMFPQLVAGPIVRYSDIAKELLEREVGLVKISAGMQRFIIGLAKKLLIADTLSHVADAAFSIPVEQLSPLAAWAGIVCYSLQIYYDFSGYSDMAIGIGKIFGFSFPENFNYPYISLSIREFWRRWHMTLSSWFRDYLYIPLGGNRYGIARTAVNLFIVFALCGFWHGAQWVFLIWGIYHGLFLAIERVFPGWPDRLPIVLRFFYTIFVVMFGWIIFRADSFSHAVSYFTALFGRYEYGVQTNHVWLKLFAGDVYLAIILGIIGATPVLRLAGDRWRTLLNASPQAFSIPAEFVRLLLVAGLMFVCMMPLFGATHSAFIYFRF